MAKYLVIVESPAKVKTIKKFLGKNYEVLASNGHVRDLPKSSLGIDVEGDFEPKYITIRGKGAHGAYPHMSVDPINAAVHVYLALESNDDTIASVTHIPNVIGIDFSDVFCHAAYIFCSF